MEGGESPLDVLSRAATMVQKNQVFSSSAKMNQLTQYERMTLLMIIGIGVRRGSLREARNLFNDMFTDRNPISELLRVSLIMRANQLLVERLEAKRAKHFWQPWLDTDDSAKHHPVNHKQTTKWKRDRRRLPEYSRKSDPKFFETFASDSTQPAAISSDGEARPPPSAPTNGHHNDTPLDMSLRQRGQPPSYAQTMSDPVYRSGYRPSVIHNGVATSGNREELPSGISMCDPIIDEHFRRSLGSDYHAVFQNNNVSKESVAQKSPPRLPTTTNVIELMDGAGLSVDDHFAKALGDTWAKLNRKDAEIKRDNPNENLVSI